MKFISMTTQDHLKADYERKHDYCDFLSGSIVVESDISLYNEEMNSLELLRLEIELYELTVALHEATSQGAQADILEEVESLLYCKELTQ